MPQYGTSDGYAHYIFHGKIIRIHCECPCRTGNLTCMNWLKMDSFSPTFKLIVPWTSGPKTRLCEIEVSHMNKRPISYRQKWEKKISTIFWADKSILA